MGENPSPEDEIESAVQNNLDAIDCIPAGTFYAEGNDELTRERILAIRLVEELGSSLAAEHPEIAAMYEDPAARLIDIARRVFPEEYVARYPEVCSKAVGWAIRNLHGREEQRELTKAHRRLIAELNFDFRNPDFITQCREAAKTRHQLHGVDTEAMIRGRGREPWTVEESAITQDLILLPAFQHQSGSMKGLPHYAKIAAEINRLFHNGRSVRTATTIGCLIRDTRRGKR